MDSTDLANFQSQISELQTQLDSLNKQIQLRYLTTPDVGNASLVTDLSNMTGLLQQTSLVQSLEVVGLTLSDNTPGAGQVTWSQCIVMMNGIQYLIPGGTTSNPFITWTVGASTFVDTNTFTPTKNLYLIATNLSGTSDTAWDKMGAGSITGSALLAFSIDATKLNIANIIVIGLTLTNNSPGAGQLAWSSCTVVYAGAAYGIAAGNTSNKLITWTVGANVFVGSDNYTPSPTIYQIATNAGGIGDTAWDKVAQIGIQAENHNVADLMVVGLTFTDNSPGAGQVSWGACTFVYNGVIYSISSGNTTVGDVIIYWTVGSSSLTSASNNNFLSGPTIIPVASCNGGIHDSYLGKNASGGITHDMILFPTLQYGRNGEWAMDSITFTDNSPIAGKCAWSAGHVTYKGITYSISASNAVNNAYIYWQLSNPTVFQTVVGPSVPILGADDFIVGINDGGSFQPIFGMDANNGVRSHHLPAVFSAFNAIGKFMFSLAAVNSNQNNSPGEMLIGDGNGLLTWGLRGGPAPAFNTPTGGTGKTITFNGNPAFCGYTTATYDNGVLVAST